MPFLYGHSLFSQSIHPLFYSVTLKTPLAVAVFSDVDRRVPCRSSPNPADRRRPEPARHDKGRDRIVPMSRVFDFSPGPPVAQCSNIAGSARRRPAKPAGCLCQVEEGETDENRVHEYETCGIRDKYEMVETTNSVFFFLSGVYKWHRILLRTIETIGVFVMIIYGL